MKNTGRTEEHLSMLNAIEPIYHKEYGDICRVYLATGEDFLDLRSIRGVKQGVTRAKALNQGYLRELCGEELGRHLSLPLPLASGLVLVPLKMRQPLTNNDSAYGLVNLLAVRRVVGSASGGSLVVLNSGPVLQALSSREITLTRLGEGTLMRQHFLQKVWEFPGTPTLTV